jgi:hypothetical protein
MLLGFVFCCRKVNHEQDCVDAVKSVGYKYDGYEIYQALHFKMNEVYVAICKPKHRK